MTNEAVKRQTIDVEHIKIESKRTFVEVKADLEHQVPMLDSRIPQSMDAADAAELRALLEAGPELAIFLSRDHGALLRIAGLTRRAVQYEIGNPLTASKMTRNRLAAGLYAPLRVILYEDDTGLACFEYDRPSSLFGQWGDEGVIAVAKGLDLAIERVLREAAGLS